MRKEFFCGKKVLVTGHTGFVGAWMSVVLHYLGATVIGLSLPPEENSLYQKIQTEFKIKEYLVDLREQHKVVRALEEIGPDIVLHIAAYGFVRECIDNPVMTFSSNVMGTVNLFEAIRKCSSVKSVLVVSSDKVYKNLDIEGRHSFKEEEPLGGIDPYSCSKTCEDMVAQSYFDTFFRQDNISINIVRPGNILGGGDHIKSRLLPNMFEKFSRGEALNIRHPHAVRPWQHILDALDAYLTIVSETSKKNISNIGIYNVGPRANGQMSVGQIAKHISNSFPGSIISISEDEYNVREAGYLDVDINKISEEFNWKPKKTMEEILDDAYNFWSQSQTKSCYTLCLEQIQSYYR